MGKIYNYFYNILGGIICGIAGGALVLVFFFCLMTPDKFYRADGSWEFTDATRYWTDDAYFCVNFSPNPIGCLIKLKEAKK